MEDSVRATGRRLQLLTLLMGGGRKSVDELARRFGVTRRTVYRDLKFLEEIPVPVVRDGGHYWIDERYRIRPVQLQPDEVLALMASLDFGRRNRALGGKAARSAQEKLLAVLPNREQELAAGLNQTLVVDPIQAHSQPAPPAVEEALRKALEGHDRVRISYQALEADAPTERVVRPYGLAYRGVALYLIGFCELRQEIRHFRANRILSAEVLETTFQRPADFDLDEYLGRIWGIEYGPQMQVRIRFDRQIARLARETIWHPTQRIEEEEGGAVLLCMTIRGKNELARWLAGYGGTVEVLDPPELREAVLALGRGIVERYRKFAQPGVAR